MVYIFDTNSFSVAGNYYPSIFPSFWVSFNDAVLSGDIISVRDVYKELLVKGSKRHLNEWVELNKSIFLIPNNDEMEFVAEIFKHHHFQQLISEQNLLKGKPVADPFIIAAAKTRNGCVVSEEENKPNSAKIPNVCSHFGVECCNLEHFMEQNGWKF